MGNNNYNICNKCGTANPLMARFCYQCGNQLKAPQEPVVCPKCNTVNISEANFCKRCGNKLVKAQATKYCPQCSTAIPADSMFCPNCRYDYRSGVTMAQQNYNQLPTPEVVPQPGAMQPIMQPSVQEKRVDYSATIVEEKGKKPRGRFFVTFLLAAILTYLAFLPMDLLPFLNFGTVELTIGEETLAFTGYTLVTNLLANLHLVGTVQSDALFVWILGVVYAVSALALVLYLLAQLVRLLFGKGYRKTNWLWFVLFVITGLIAAICATANQVLAGSTLLTAIYTSLLKGITAIQCGYNLYVLPATFLILFVLSACLRTRKEQKQVISIQR